MLVELVKSMRPIQWYKNLVIFIAIIFSYNIFSLELWLRSIFAFTVFCLISGSVYIINDIKDIDRDRLHPKKKFRPIASGALSPRIALIAASVLLIVALSASFVVVKPLSYIALIYVCISLLYTFYLKYIALLDVMVIAFGFVLRAIAGSLAINVIVSPWLILCVPLMAFVLAFGKRRHELLSASNSRDCLSQYTEKMVEDLMNISISMLLISYSLYTFYVHPHMMITLPFAFYGVFRFVQLIYLRNFGEEAELILKDKASIVNLALWISFVMIVLYVVNS